MYELHAIEHIDVYDLHIIKHIYVYKCMSLNIYMYMSAYH